MSSIVNKVKEALSSDKSTSTSHNTHNTHNTSGDAEGTHGPHTSRVANAADPRVDSDRDGSHNTGRTAGYGEHSTGNTGYGSNTGGFIQGTGHGDGPTHHALGTSGSGFTGSGTREGEYGHHNTRTANALDPRVDSDRDGSRNAGAAYGSSGHTTDHTGTSGLTGSTGHSGLTGSSGLGQHSSGNAAGYGDQSNTGYGNSSTREGEHGPHSSHTANALDPRVDSDRDGSRNIGGAYGSSGHTGTSGFGSSGHTGNTTGHHAGSGATGMTGTHGASAGTYGTHDSRMANAADPRIDSDRDGRGALGHNVPGPAPNTAGPHKSDMMNKLDPRVDSDMDHSKTYGGNKTYQTGQHESLTARKDPTDAAQVPPSVLQQTIGAPTVEHGDHHHGRERRNSSATHQETYRGV